VRESAGSAAGRPPAVDVVPGSGENEGLGPLGTFKKTVHPLVATRPARLLVLLLVAAGCRMTGPSLLGPGDLGTSAGHDDLGAGPGDGGGSGGGDLALPPTASAGIRIIVEPGDKGQSLVAAIAGATTSIHMTMYLMTNTAVLKALIARKDAQHDIKVVLNQTFPDSGTSNQAQFDQLAAAGISVVWAAPAFTYTHEKCLIIDGKQAWIMTMNATQSALTGNREYLAVDTNADDVAEAEAIFAADFAGQSIVPSGPLVVSPVNSRDRLVALVQSATATLDLEVEELSDGAVIDALVARRDAGVAVRVVLPDSTRSPAQANAVTTLGQHGVRLVTVTAPYIHAKAIVADGTVAFIGSENLTSNSLQNNRELGVIFAAPAEVKKVAGTIAADFAAGTAL
jgi:phosphatidylserine/phosphatidylglycerophosphate/cardiolipin synthase-like enzyme